MMNDVALQFGLFLVAGTLTTLLDFVIYNLLTREAVGWGRIPANCVSTTFAMTFSFTVNWLFVFQPAGGDVALRAIKFVAVTAASSYGLQNLVIYVLSKVWPGPVRLVYGLAQGMPATRSWGEDFVGRNTVKAAAVGAGILWNFLWYRYFVYAG
jgi:putative flippase GtrA